jgi:hypothetical protein
MFNRIERAPGKGLFMQLRFSLNIPDKAVHSEDVEQDNIPTLVRLFNEGNRSSLYQPDTFGLHGVLSLPTLPTMRTLIFFFTLTALTGQYLSQPCKNKADTL